MNVEIVIISKMIGNLVSGSPTGGGGGYSYSQQGGQGVSMSNMAWFLKNDKGFTY